MLESVTLPPTHTGHTLTALCCLSLSYSQFSPRLLSWLRSPHITFPLLPLRPCGFELFVFVRSIKIKARWSTGAAASTFDPLCPPCHRTTAAEPSGRFRMPDWALMAHACTNSNWLARSSAKGSSPDSWWVDAAHQLEKQRDTGLERKVHFLWLHRKVRAAGMVQRQEKSLYFYLSKSILVDCRKWGENKRGDIPRTYTFSFFNLFFKMLSLLDFRAGKLFSK